MLRIERGQVNIAGKRTSQEYINNDVNKANIGFRNNRRN